MTAAFKLLAFCHCVARGDLWSLRSTERRRPWRFALAIIAAMAMVPAASRAQSSAQIQMPDVILADPGETIDLPIMLAPEQVVPNQALIRIKGLPKRIALNAGYLVSAGTWAVPLTKLQGLKATVPDDLTARAEISVLLVDVEGRVHAEKQARLIVARTGNSGASASAGGTISVASIDIPPLASTIAPVPALATRPTKVRDILAKGAADPVYALPALTPDSKLKLSSAFRLELEDILAEGDQALLVGDVEFARRVYRHVTERGLGLAAIKMAETFDPNERPQRRIADGAEDPALARAWYRRAADLGERRALERLQRLERR